MEGGILIYRFVVEKFLIRMRGVSSLEYAVQKIYMQQRESFEVSFDRYATVLLEMKRDKVF